MFRSWLAGHRSLVASATSVSVVFAMVAVVSFVSTGYTAKRLDLGDGAVWVANNEQQAVGRVNTEILELNSVVSSTGNDIDVLQQGQTVLLFDRSESTIDIIDAATSQVRDSVPLPPNQPEVYLAGDNVVILEQGTGELWIAPMAGFAEFDPQSEASLSLGKDSAISVDPNGLLFAVSPSTGKVYEVNAAASDAFVSTTTIDVNTGGGPLVVTSVSGEWAVLDAETGLLYLDGRTADLTSVVSAGPGLVLQWPSIGGEQVLIGYGAGLLGVPLGGVGVVGIVDGMSGVAARPFVLDGCEFGGWTGGSSWRRCAANGEGTMLALDSMAANARLSFVANGERAVLNDRNSGETWAVQRDGELVDNWDQLIVVDDEIPESQQNNEDLSPEIDVVDKPPVAIDDDFGARPGKASVLPVLFNDYDPNGDVLVIGELVAIDGAYGRIDLVNDRQQIQLTLEPGASGELSFAYTITDGRGGSASALVNVAIRDDSVNTAPVQVRSTSGVVQAGGRLTTSVLADWMDPDGDPFYLQSAAVAEPDAVAYKPEGITVYSDSGAGGDLKTVSLVVSDGVALGSGSLSIRVRPAGSIQIVTEPFFALAHAGEAVTISPLSHVRGGTGVIRLNSVPAKTDATIVPSYETGTFSFASDQVRTHYIEYVVTDGSETASGVVRIDVTTPPDPNTKPITTPKNIFVTLLESQRVDVTASDVDPAGGVLLVTGVMNVPVGSGVRAEVLEQRIIQVSLDKPLDNGPITFNYRISNGLSESEGVVTVTEIAMPSRAQPPVANDDSVTVRMGDAIDIRVLDNDEHPGGLEITLQPEFDQRLPSGAGLLFASGRVLRYLAPQQTGNFTASYRITGPDGQAATAQVRIAVREADVATNNPPVPRMVTARVLQGESVSIRIPLNGIDPDGDSVQLLGQATNPQMGAVLGVESDVVVYQAGDYSKGTDSFTYTVIDSLGARAIGIVRVGISPRLEGARNPVAVLDEVIVRPGVTVSVLALANDSDPDGSPLAIVSAEPTAAGTLATIVGQDTVDITPPLIPGSYVVLYSIQNAKGGSSQSFIRVKVDPDAARSYPQARDTVLTLSDVLDRSRVTVDVLANVFFADGPTRSLELSVHPGYTAFATVTAAKQIEVEIGDRSRIIPFKVTHPDDAEVFGYAFIRVPGFDDTLPQVDRRAPALRVNSEDRLLIDINDYVVAVGDKQVKLTDSSTVQATHSNGGDLVVDAGTLSFISADKYFGPASISFEVTDGVSADGTVGRTATLVLPITVLPRANQPPDFNGADLVFEPGQEMELDLLRLTTYKHPDDVGELAYSLIGAVPATFTHTLVGNILTLRANDGTAKGTRASISIGVRDDLSVGGAGRIELSVVQSTRPLLSPALDSAIAKRGQTTSVDVLTNDEVTNPFPGQPLRVIDIRGLAGASLPAGIEIKPSEDRSKLAVSIAAGTRPTDVNLQYQVADASNDPERYVWGTVRVSVQDRPDPVSSLFPSGFGDRSITMRWNAGSSNNSPITGYKVVTTPSNGVAETTVCTGTICAVGTKGNGPANSVRISVIATNAIGDSDPFALVDDVWSDIIPPAPTTLGALPLNNGLILTWDAVSSPAGGSAVDRYRVSVGALTTDVKPSVCTGGICTWRTSTAGWFFDNGVAVSYTVSARNAALTALSVWNTSEPRSAVPAGPPIAVAAPTAKSLGDSTIELSWAGVFANNGKAVLQYTAAVYSGKAPTCAADGTVTPNSASVFATAAATANQFTGLSPDTSHTLIVFAFNGQGCSASVSVVAQTPPPIVTSLNAPLVNNQDGTWDFALLGGVLGTLPLVSDYSVFYRISGGSAVGGERGPISLGGRITAAGSQYGNSISISARACRSYGVVPVCQLGLSAPIPLGTAVDARVTGYKFTPDPGKDDGGGTFSWLGWPTGSSYDGIQFACGGTSVGPFVAGETTASGSCYVAPNESDSSMLTIRVLANNGVPYDMTYQED